MPSIVLASALGEVSNYILNGANAMLAEMLQPTHLLIVGAILVFFFGGRWFKRLGYGFRDAVRNFRNAGNASRPK